jgi:hypothetical protein
MWKSQFSINKIGHILVPHRHRQPRFIAWVKVFLAYLASVKEALYLRWDETVLDASMTPQIIYLEHILNIIFERTDIFIDEGSALGPWIFRNTETPDPEFCMDQADSFVFNNQEAVWVDFTVNIPAAVESQTSRIAAIVHKYKLPGKLFIIQIFH